MRRLLLFMSACLLSAAVKSDEVTIAGTHVSVTPDNMPTYKLCLNVIAYLVTEGEIAVKLSAPNRSEGVTFNSASAGDYVEGRQLSFQVTPQKKSGRHLIILSGSAERLRNVYITLWYGPAGDRLRTYNIRLSAFIADDEQLNSFDDSSYEKIYPFGVCNK